MTVHDVHEIITFESVEDVNEEGTNVLKWWGSTKNECSVTYQCSYAHNCPDFWTFQTLLRLAATLLEFLITWTVCSHDWLAAGGWSLCISVEEIWEILYSSLRLSVPGRQWGLIRHEGHWGSSFRSTNGCGVRTGIAQLFLRNSGVFILCWGRVGMVGLVIMLV